MKVAVIGRTQMLLNAARLLVQNGHQIVFVATAKPAPEYTASSADFARFAEETGAIFVQGVQLSQHTQAIGAAGADVAISMNWPAILDADILALFPLGVLNAHPGNLPRYRGNACPNWAMLSGEREVVLTIHQMAPGELDSGPILLKHSIPLFHSTTIGQVYQELERVMPGLYLKAAEGLFDASLKPQAQSTNRADILRVYPRLPQDSLMDWNLTSETLARLVRASSEPFSGAYTYYKGKKLTIWSACSGCFEVPSYATPGQVVAIHREVGTVDVAAGVHFLTLGRVGYEGKTYEKPAELISSLRARLGMVVADEVALLREEVAALRARLAALEATGAASVERKEASDA